MRYGFSHGEETLCRDRFITSFLATNTFCRMLKRVSCSPEFVDGAKDMINRSLQNIVLSGTMCVRKPENERKSERMTPCLPEESGKESSTTYAHASRFWEIVSVAKASREMIALIHGDASRSEPFVLRKDGDADTK